MNRRKFLETILIAIIGTFLVNTNTYAKEPVTIYLSGDSTCAIKMAEKRPETGWGEMFEKFFQEGKVKIDNRAMNGRSTKTFLSEGRWQAIIDALKAGDYVFIQFGHNDEAKEKQERYTPPEEFGKNLIRFVEEVRAKKANPVLLTPVMRRRFDKDGKFYDTHGEYPDITRSVAKDLNVPLLDLHKKTETLLIKYGAEESKKLFLILKEGESPNYPKGLDDNTHFNPRGAEEVAKLVVEEIQSKKINLRKLLKK